MIGRRDDLVGRWTVAFDQRVPGLRAVVPQRKRQGPIFRTAISTLCDDAVAAQLKRALL